MKKIIFLMAAAAMAGGMLTSCKEDTQPRLEKPTEFVLNTPPTANEILILAQNEEEGSTVNFTVSQPNYGLGTPTHYEVQLSYTPDFAEMYAIPTVNTQAKIEVEAKEFAVGMNYLNGIREEGDSDKFTGDPRQVYVRVRAYIPNCDYSSILSNVISVWAKPYFVVSVPAQIFMVGDASPAGWSQDEVGYVLDESENGIGSNIFSGTFYIAAGKATFRFYSKLGDWENNSIGTQNEDKAIAFKGFPDGVGSELETDVVVGKAEKEGKGSWSFPDWPGGEMKITIDLNNDKAYFVAVSLD